MHLDMLFLAALPGSFPVCRGVSCRLVVVLGGSEHDSDQLLEATADRSALHQDWQGLVGAGQVPRNQVQGSNPDLVNPGSNPDGNAYGKEGDAAQTVVHEGEGVLLREEGQEELQEEAQREVRVHGWIAGQLQLHSDELYQASEDWDHDQQQQQQQQQESEAASGGGGGAFHSAQDVLLGDLAASLMATSAPLEAVDDADADAAMLFLDLAGPVTSEEEAATAAAEEEEHVHAGMLDVGASASVSVTNMMDAAALELLRASREQRAAQMWDLQDKVGMGVIAGTGMGPPG